MSNPTILLKNLNRKYKITQAEIEKALYSGTDLCHLVADKFSIDEDQVKRICDVYISLLIIKKSIASRR